MEISKALQLSTTIISRIAENCLPYENGNICFLFGEDNEGPYMYDDLLTLIPSLSTWDANDEDGPTEDYSETHFMVFDHGESTLFDPEVRNYIDQRGNEARFLPSEGFLDLILFGYNWWEEYPHILDQYLIITPGLQYAKSLEDPGFRLPSTEAVPTGAGTVDGSGFREIGDLRANGYSVTNGSGIYFSGNERWLRLQRIIDTNKMNLRQAAYDIATLVKGRKRQRNGIERNWRSIAAWETDLQLLKSKYYDNRTHNFVWPSTNV